MNIGLFMKNNKSILLPNKMVIETKGSELIKKSFTLFPQLKDQLIDLTMFDQYEYGATHLIRDNDFESWLSCIYESCVLIGSMTKKIDLSSLREKNLTELASELKNINKENKENIVYSNFGVEGAKINSKLMQILTSEESAATLGLHLLNEEAKESNNQKFFIEINIICKNLEKNKKIKVTISRNKEICQQFKKIMDCLIVDKIFNVKIIDGIITLSEEDALNLLNSAKYELYYYLGYAECLKKYNEICSYQIDTSVNRLKENFQKNINKLLAVSESGDFKTYFKRLSGLTEYVSENLKLLKIDAPELKVSTNINENLNLLNRG